MNPPSRLPFAPGAGQPEVLAIIPARGGSKGIPRKNIADLGGRPLLAWTVDAARQARRVTRVLVSTDDPEIAEAARAAGAEVPFLRSGDTARDESTSEAVVCEVLERLAARGYNPAMTVQLYPTSPFREPGLVDFLVEKLAAGCQQVKTVRPVATRVVRSRAHGGLLPLPNPLAGAMRPYGLFYGLNHLAYQPYTYYLHPIVDPLSLIDIDTPDDLEFARTVLEQGLVPWISD